MSGRPTTATDHALATFDELLRAWLGPVTLEHLLSANADEPLRRAILAIARQRADRLPIGYSVFSQRYDIISDTGYDYQIVSAVLPAQAHAENALQFCLAKKRETGLGYLVGRIEEC